MTISDALGANARQVMIVIFRKKDATAVDRNFGECSSRRHCHVERRTVASQTEAQGEGASQERADTFRRHGL